MPAWPLAVPFDMPGRGLDHTPLPEVTLQSCVDVVCQAIDAAPGPVITMNTSHSPFFSQPQALAEHLLQIAASN